MYTLQPLACDFMNISSWKQITVDVSSVSIDSAVGEDVHLLIADTEGAEILVLKSGLHFIERHAILHAM
jgi:hypothetical protein